MNLSKLKTFQVVAEELNYTRASIRLNYSQSTVTKHIQSLEKDLGVCLLNRREGKYSLTKAGIDLYNSSIIIFKEMDSIRQLNNEVPVQEELILQGHDYYLYKYFLPGIQKLSYGFPNVKYIMRGANNKSTVASLYKGDIDMGIISGNVLPGEFKSTIIGYENVVICINHQAYRPQYSLEDYLERYPVAIDESEIYRSEHLFPFIKKPYVIINTDSDEVVEEAIVNQRMLGVVRDGRLKKHLQSEQIKIIETIIKNDPVYLIMEKTKENNGLYFAMYDIIVELANPRKKDTIKWL